jgi:hypothetical protein
MNNESAASLIQSVTVRSFQSASLPECPSYVAFFFVMLWPFARHAVAIFHRCLIVDRERRGMRQIASLSHSKPK